MSPSLEHLIENEDLGIEILHPGGLEITGELSELCHIGKNTKVLDIASGTGESAFYLVQNFGCHVTGIDISDSMIKRARKKAIDTGIIIKFKKGDAHDLAFDDNTFDVVISECAVSFLNKEQAIGEMVRVVKPGGSVGIHDIYWKESASEHMKSRFAEIERERPETLEGWGDLFRRAGLVDVMMLDRSSLVQSWWEEIKKRIGITGKLKIFFKVFRKWGLSGLKNVRESMEIFQSQHLGYGIIIGKKP